MSNVLKEMEIVDYGNFPVKLLQADTTANRNCFPMHWHDRMEILRILKGRVIINCGNSTITAEKDDIVIINCKQTHFANTDDVGVSYAVIMFELSRFLDNEFFGDKYIKQLLFKRIKIKNIIKDKKLLEILDSIINYGKVRGQLSAMIIEGKILEFLALLLKNHIDTDESYQSGDAKFMKVLEFIDEHFTEDLQVPELAQRFSYDKSYFCRKFKSQTGVTCGAYIKALRMEAAGALLKKNKDSISAIAEMCGYNDANYFTRCFKEIYGVTPTQWRRQQKESLRDAD